MAPVSEDLILDKDMSAPDQTGSDKIVISGMSGLFPQSHNIQELSDILYNKVNPVTVQEKRWDYNHPELPQYVGMAPDLYRFDAQFFSVSFRIAQHLDPMSRKILENTFQAIYDAGLSPGHLYGQRVAVFVGSSFAPTEKDGMINPLTGAGLGLLGTNKTMFANRISYWLNLNGPSVSIDDADCSSTSALEQAYLAIKRGACKAAIVAGAQTCLHPQELIHHGRLGAISRDGQTRSYADDASGYTLSDGIGVILLQKSKDALRCYAELVHVKNEFILQANHEKGSKFGYYRDPENTAKFIKSFYKTAQVNPRSVEYVEGFGSGDPEVDKCELQALSDVYCENREKPLFVGSVTSNIGNTGAASGIASITKVLLGYHHGKLAGNLHCENPRKDIPALRNGNMRIVNEHEPLHEEYAAINGMSITGVSSHVLLKGHYKPKDLSQYKSTIPYLVLLSGRQESSVEKIIGSLKSRPIDAEEISLYHNIHSKNISGHLGRGYTILDTNAEHKTISLCEKIDYFDDAKRPLWFVYSGMGSQWNGMGTDLMRIPIFAKAIERCDRVLKPKGLDIVDIITSLDKSMFDNIMNAFVGITAVQIGLTDILRELGLVPDGIIGHSLGEIACAYVDGCLTAEQTILAAWSRGKASIDTTFIHGSMAAIGLGYNQISTMCPPEIDVACHNGPNSSTISGPADVITDFVAELTAKGIFSKEVPTANIAYHSRYIAKAGPNILKLLKEVIKNPKRRSEKWLSTSVPQDQWNEESAKYCSAEYQTNNLLNPVLFEETLRLLPHNAVTVEISPHGLLQAILKRALPAESQHVALTRRGHPDNILYLLQAIGNLYVGGYTPNVQALYPRIQFPVSTKTPMLSHQVEWMHVEAWKHVPFSLGDKYKTAACKFIQSIHDDEHSYLRGNVIQGKNCYPFAAALIAAWDTFAMSAGATKRAVSIYFQDLQICSQPLLLNQRPLTLEVALQRGTGRFEVTTEFSKIMTGSMVLGNKIRSHYSEASSDDEKNMKINAEDIYQLLKDRGYNYSGEFCSIESADKSFDEAALIWRDNWVTLIDGMLQLNAVKHTHHGVSQPTHIRQILIDVNRHSNQLYVKNGKRFLKAVVDDECDFTRCGGVLIRGIAYRHLPEVKGPLSIELFANSDVQNVNQLRSIDQDLAVTNKTLQSVQVGKLDTLHWVQAPRPEPSNFNVKVHFAALNVLDHKRATGATPSDTNMYGMDYSGITDSGQRVMGIIRGGAASSQVRAQPELLWPVPQHWTLEDAATVPLAYAHAFYALVIKGNMKPGMSILVHGGVGALGQAIITIALAHNCQVFTTVSDVRKKEILRKRFPQIKDENIGNSRDASFADQVMIATQSKGCDIVVSCVTGDFKNLSLKCSGFFGKFIDTTQLQDREIFDYGMYFLEIERSYVRIDLSSLFTQNKLDDMKLLQKMISDGISSGYVVPLTRVTYAAGEAPRAFSFLGTGQHRGRVLLRIQDNSKEVEQRIICDSNKYQVMYWDSNLSVQLADRLIVRGAKKLYIFSRTLTTYQQLKIRSWQQLGITVIVSSEDLSNKEKVLELLKDALSNGNIEGIYIILANPIENRTSADLTAIVNNLDFASRSCQQLRYFTVVSTINGLGQDICVSRSKSGFTATHLNLCVLNEVGISEGPAIIDAIEQALCNSHIELLARPKYLETSSLLEHISALTDINITEKNKDLTLKELGVSQEQARRTSAYLDVTYNICLEDTNVLELTINRINDIQNSVLDTEPAPIEGLATFYSHIGTDEITATTDLVLLPTAYSDVLTLDDFALGERYLYIVPGMEGDHNRFRYMCERLKLPALVLQPGVDYPDESVQETAQRFAETLKNKAEVQNNFYILGYESGVLVALELAAILEKQGFTGTVFCVGLEPDDLQAELEKQLKDFKTQDQLENALIRHILTLLTGKEFTETETALTQADSFTQKLDTCLHASLRHMSHTAQYARALMKTALARIEKTRRNHNYSNLNLRTQIILLRAATAPNSKSTLQQYSQQPIITHQSQYPLAHVLKDSLCPSLINRYLDKDLKEAFELKNLCHTYNAPKNLRIVTE